MKILLDLGSLHEKKLWKGHVRSCQARASRSHTTSLHFFLLLWTLFLGCLSCWTSEWMIWNKQWMMMKMLECCVKRVFRHFWDSYFPKKTFHKYLPKNVGGVTWTCHKFSTSDQFLISGCLTTKMSYSIFSVTHRCMTSARLPPFVKLSYYWLQSSQFSDIRINKI